MTKRIDWDDVGRSQRAQKHGTQSAYDELPPVGSYADKVRSSEEKWTVVAQKKSAKQKTKPTINERLQQLHQALEELAVIFIESEQKNIEHQHCILSRMQSTLSSMLKIDSSILKKLDSSIAQRQLKAFVGELVDIEDKELWQYHVGDYRLIINIKNQDVVIFAAARFGFFIRNSGLLVWCLSRGFCEPKLLRLRY
ncbi:MAG: hypothetical protein WAX77_10630 [Methylococcaceae bacterium]